MGQAMLSSIIARNALSAQKEYKWAIAPDEAIQVGWLAYLVRAKSGFAGMTERKKLFVIAMRVRGAVVDHVRTTSEFKKAGGPRKMVFLAEETDEYLDSIGALSIAPVADEYEKYTAEDIIGLADEGDRDLLMRMYIYTEGVKGIARFYGVTVCVAEFRLVAARKRLRKKLDKNNYF